MKRPEKKDVNVMNGFTGMDKRYYSGYNQGRDDMEKWIIKRLEIIQSLLPPKDKQKRNIINLLGNWKAHINAIDKLIKELKQSQKE